MKIPEAYRSTVYYLLGCALGGLILGVFVVKFYSQKFIVQATPPEEVVEKVEPSPIPSESPVLEVDNLTTILFTGDVMLGRSVNENIIQNQNTGWPFINVLEVMKAADITYINLESPFVSNCPLTSEGMKFCSDIANVSGLVSAGVDVASVANNHSTNYGADGLNETKNALEKNGISVVGMNNPVSIMSKYKQYTFLSYNDVGRYAGISQADSEPMLSQVRLAKKNSQVVIVGFHWGLEYHSQPTKRQITLAHAVIDAGADLVIGAHPHWVQTSEIYNEKPIYYSLGNFVFDQEWSKETKRGLAVRFTYRGSELIKTEELPVFIEQYGQPRWQ